MGCWAALWSAVLLAVLKAMGQNAHLWKTWQCRSWMWLFSKAKVRWTTPQCTHLDRVVGVWEAHEIQKLCWGRRTEGRSRAISGVPHPLHPSHVHAESLSAATTPTAMLAGTEREGNGPKMI